MSIIESLTKKQIRIILQDWLEENHEEIMTNINGTIQDWLDVNKEEIFKIIKENSTKLSK